MVHHPLGGEFGPAWHQAALKANRNKAYEDFIAVGEHLVSSGICKPKTLGIKGGSNGGLLMGNMYVMRPDLFGAIHCAVPLLDMKRFHTLLAGASWMAEYGDPDKDWDDFLYKYSPYQLIDESVESYPPMLVTTSTRDDRVHPGHARKMVKKLWDLGVGKDWPVFYYENIEGTCMRRCFFAEQGKIIFFTIIFRF
jgi:prolyl oligopeptidase